MNNEGVYGMKVNFFCSCLMMTAMVSPKNRKSKANAYLETYPMIIMSWMGFLKESKLGLVLDRYDPE